MPLFAGHALEQESLRGVSVPQQTGPEDPQVSLRPAQYTLDSNPFLSRSAANKAHSAPNCIAPRNVSGSSLHHAGKQALCEGMGVEDRQGGA